LELYATRFFVAEWTIYVGSSLEQAEITTTALTLKMSTIHEDADYDAACSKKLQ